MDFINEARKHQDQIVKDLVGLVQIPSLTDPATVKPGAPFGDALRKALDYTLAMGQRDGFKTRDLEGYAGVIEFGEGTEIMGILGHLDVVPIGTGWTFDPFGGTIKDGFVMGRGAQDDKGPSIAGYAAMRLLKNMGITPKKRVFLILGTDEESGMACMKYYKQHGEIPQFGFVPDADFPVIYGEKGILNLKVAGKADTQIVRLSAGERPNVVIGEAEVTLKGSPKGDYFSFYLKAHHLSGSVHENDGFTTYAIKGRYAHGSLPQEGINAAWHLLNFVGSAYDDATAYHLATLLEHYRGDALGIRVFGSHMGFLTMNVGIVRIEDNTVDITLDIRYPQETNEQFILSQVDAAFNAVLPGLSTTIIAHKGPLFVDPQSKLVSTLEKIYRKYSGDTQTKLLTMGGGTYARSFDNFVAFGAEFPLRQRPAWVGQVHQADEGYEIEQLILATAIYAQAIYDLACV
jgi:succinyl-diaminopimelate desuccinylase